MASEVPDGGIVLARHWKLVPMDERNWELCQFRTPLDNHGNPKDGEPRWFRCGRFYSYNGVDRAMEYVLDQLAKERAYGESMELGSALAEWRRLVGELRESAAMLADAMRGAAR